MRRVNPIFIEPSTGAGPKQMCEVCRQYKTWRNGSWVCPQCGSQGAAADVVRSTRKVLKADTAQPFIVNSKPQKAPRSADFPPGAQIIEDRLV